MNILMLMAGDSNVTAINGGFPLCLHEVDGKILLEHLIEQYKPLPHTRMICIVREEDSRKHHLENIIHLVYPDAVVINIKNQTRGALCTALLASHQINNQEDLLIVNSNELIKKDPVSIIDDFKARSLDAATITFPSVHPRYSFVRLDQQGFVTEASEKNPISHFATAGFYWYKNGCDFVEAAKNTLRKDAHCDGIFYICPVFNELILQGKRIATYPIRKEDYLPLKNECQLGRVQFTEALLRGVIHNEAA